MASKFYVVFKGFNPGVYDSWEEVQQQTNGFPGAVYKSYPSSEEAGRAYRRMSEIQDRNELLNLIRNESSQSSDSQPKDYHNYPEIDLDAWAVDASCLRNPGKMEYRGVDLRTGREIFRMGPYEDATNNIGEFLALVHAMALMTKNGEYHNIYSDSKTGMNWVRKKMPKTSLQSTPRNDKVFELLARAKVWLETHQFPAKIMKWDTDRWGEIPADFGRK